MDKISKIVRKPTSQACAFATAPTPTPRQAKIALMLELSNECGFVCQALAEFNVELASLITSHLAHRVGRLATLC